MEKSSFFKSINGDRKYKVEDFAEFFNSFVTNGVFPNPSTNLQVIANNDMTVTLKLGKCWINGYIYYNDGDLILNVDVADGVLNRIDRIVLRMDTAGRAINAVVKKGSFASSPVAPILQRDADGYELGIADIYVGKGVVSIVQANITDLRMNTNLCGWVNSLIQADTTAIFNQYLDWYNTKQAQYNTDISVWTQQKQTDFTNWYNNTTSNSQSNIDSMEAQFQQDWNNWFATIRSVLSGDTAGNLLNLINANTSNINSLAGAGRTTETVKENADAIANLGEKVTSHLADNTAHGANLKANQSDLISLIKRRQLGVRI
ncbi:hypothetical protein ACJDU8_15795 [Clostridium sp. WILCCON 0269]|uniref:Uncharacterized protein n=1 Tax=Candidatus Clostridium eludens TaxID=3381663 RepID=A0ABW8SQR6_9CLOT